MTTHTDADAIVVGAGPVGMTAALALAARGLQVTIVERETTTSDAPKAISLDDESLRLFQAIGIADDVLRIIVPGTGTAYYGADDERVFLARAAKPYRLGFPFKNPFAQPDLERVLLEAMERDPRIEVRFGCEVTGIEQDPHTITATVSQAGRSERLTAEYLVGADGGRSTVRRELGIPMRGESFSDVWVVVDTLGDQRRERYGMHHANPERPHVIVPGLDGRCRYEFWISPEEAASFSGEPPFDLIRHLVEPYREIAPEEVERAVAYTFHALNAARWRSGRAFLAGDAAHMMPPFAGQGLNSGMRDIANLAWKIAHACAAGSTDDFLDTYESERRPHAEAVIRSSVKLGRVVMTTNRRLAEFRDRVVRQALDTPDGRAFFEEMRYRPANRLDIGLVVPDPETPAVGLQIGQPQAFDFDHHAVVPFDELLGNGWSVIAVGLEPAPVAATAAAFDGLAGSVVAVPLDDLIDDHAGTARTAIDVDGGLYAELSGFRGRLLLVRPDRFVAMSWQPGADARAAEQLRTWLRGAGAATASAADTVTLPHTGMTPTLQRKETQWTAPIA